MTISRTNTVTNPAADGGSTTGWAGTGATLATTASLITGQSRKFFRATLTNTTAGSYTQRADMSTPAASATPNKQYLFSVWVRNTGTPRTTSVTAYFMNAASAQIGASIAVGTNVGSTFAHLTTTATAPAGTDHILLRVGVNNDQSNWVVGDFFDYGMAYAGEYGPYFDGAVSASTNKTYAWTGTAYASMSTETVSLPTTTCQEMVDAPCPRVGVTVDGLGAGNTVYNLWRTSDGARTVVRGARNRSTVDSDYVIDYEAPLGRPVSYDIEVVTGTNYLAATFPDTATVTSSTWWIQDPLVPSSAIPLAVNHQDTTIPNLTAAAVKALAYAADINIIPILGSSQPVALMGTRQVASGVDFSMFTRAAEATTTLRDLIQQTPLLLVRTNGVRNDGVPGLAYFASAKPTEMPVTVAYGGTLTQWQLQGDLVAAPSLNVLVPIWTYETVAALWATYQQAQTTLTGKRYLDVLKSPTGV